MRNSDGTDSGRKNLGEKAIDRFTEMMISRMEQMKSVGWKQGWIGNASAPGAMPQNVSGRTYSGSNSFFLQMDTAMRGYSMPVYLTFMQTMDLKAHVRKGEAAMPVVYWDIMAKDENGKKVSKETLRNMTLEQRAKVKKIPFLKAYHVFNIDQTNFAEVQPEKFELLKKLLLLQKYVILRGCLSARLSTVCSNGRSGSVPSAMTGRCRERTFLPQRTS